MRLTPLPARIRALVLVPLQTRAAWLHRAGVTLLVLLAIVLALLAWQEARHREQLRAQQATLNVTRLLEATVNAHLGQADLLLRVAAQAAADLIASPTPLAHSATALDDAARLKLQAQLRSLMRSLSSNPPAPDIPAAEGLDGAAGIDTKPVGGAAAMTPGGAARSASAAPSSASAALTVRGGHPRAVAPAATGLTELQVLPATSAAAIVTSTSTQTATPAGTTTGDAAGTTPRPPGPGASAETSGLRISGPLRADNRWVLRLERPVPAARTTPQWLLRVDLPINSLAPLFAGIRLGDGGAAALRTSTMGLVWREPWPATAPGPGDPQVAPELVAAINRAPRDGEFAAVSVADGIRRANAYRQVGNFPLYLVVGAPSNDLRGQVGRQELLLIAVALASLLVAAVGSVLMRRSARRDVDAARRHVEAIVVSSYDAIISKTLEGRITSWNAAAEAMFGYSAAEMIGQSMHRLIPLDRRHEEDFILERLGRGEIVDHFETVRERKDGSPITVSVTISPLRDARGTIIGASKIARDITRQKQVETQMRELAFNDPLTGLANRRLLFDRLHQAQAASRRSRQWAALIYIDLDRFKQINDSLGHDTGDKLLVEVAQRLIHAVRASDTVARMGGDEFVVLCTDLGTDAAQADTIAQALLTKVSHAIEGPLTVGTHQVDCSASLGLQLFTGASTDMDLLVQQADAAMYEAKQRRRGLRFDPGP